MYNEQNGISKKVSQGIYEYFLTDDAILRNCQWRGEKVTNGVDWTIRKCIIWYLTRGVPVVTNKVCSNAVSVARIHRLNVEDNLDEST